MTKREELKKCPRCGNTPTTYEIKAGYGEVRCDKCGLAFPDGIGGVDMLPPSELVKGWNSLRSD